MNGNSLNKWKLSNVTGIGVYASQKKNHLPEDNITCADHQNVHDFRVKNLSFS